MGLISLTGSLRSHNILHNIDLTFSTSKSKAGLMRTGGPRCLLYVLKGQWFTSSTKLGEGIDEEVMSIANNEKPCMWLSSYCWIITEKENRVHGSTLSPVEVIDMEKRHDDRQATMNHIHEWHLFWGLFNNQLFISNNLNECGHRSIHFYGKKLLPLLWLWNNSIMTTLLYCK